MGDFSGNGGSEMMAAVDSSALVNTMATERSDELIFDSHDAAYCYYKEYAKSVGFGTAKLSSRRSRSSKEFIDAKFSCIRYGNKQQSDDAINPRPSPKIGCKASMHVKRRQDGKWYVYSYVKEHNHELLPSQVHFFRSHREPDPSKLRRKRNHSTLPKTLPYQNQSDNSSRNQQDRGRCLILEPGDGKQLFEFFSRMQEENSKFFYAVDFNEEHRLRNVFWVDAKGVEDYSNFNDAVSLDTSFVPKYKLPLVLFVGVNHHTNPFLLGCGLIADETVFTFAWLIQTWVSAMGGKSPQVFLTDQNPELKLAVQSVLPQARHCFSLWCIMEKLPRHLEYLAFWHESFVSKFTKCVMKSSNEEQFEKRWWKLNDAFHLKGVEWIESLYAERRNWVPIFMRGVFIASLSAPTRAECVVSVFDRYVNEHTNVVEFIARYKGLVEDRYEEEAKADFDAWHGSPPLKSPSPFEKQVAEVYTAEIFRRFQGEVVGAAACHLSKEYEDELHSVFSVKDFEDGLRYFVEWNESKMEICCSCFCFEFKGYLCRHSIVVLQMSGVFDIPCKYVLKRWTNAAKCHVDVGERLEDLRYLISRYNDLCRRAVVLCEEASLSMDGYHFAVNAIKQGLDRVQNACVLDGRGKEILLGNDQGFLHGSLLQSQIAPRVINNFAYDTPATHMKNSQIP